MEEDTLRCLSCEVLLTNMTASVCLECEDEWNTMLPKKTIKEWREQQ